MIVLSNAEKLSDKSVGCIYSGCMYSLVYTTVLPHHMSLLTLCAVQETRIELIIYACMHVLTHAKDCIQITHINMPVGPIYVCRLYTYISAEMNNKVC